MNCEDVRAEIELYVLGGTDEIRGRLVEEHLSRCPPCRALECQYMLLVTNLRSQRQSSPADSSLVRKVVSAGALPLKRARMRKRLVRLTSAGASVAAALLLAAFVWDMWRGGSEGEWGGRAEAALTPGKTLWQKANAIGTGLANADEIIVAKDTVFFLAGDDGSPYVSAVDAGSGRTRWQSDLISYGYLETDGERIYCVVSAERGKIELAALDIGSGEVEWTFEMPGASGSLYQPSRPTVVSGGRICWVCENAVYSLDASTGAEIWRRIFEDESCISRTAIVGAGIYTAGRSGIYCLSAESGEIRWRLPRRFYTWAGAKPLIASAGSDELFVAAGSKDGRSLVQCIETSTQRCVWEKLVPRVAHLYVDSAHVYLRCQDVIALARDSGEPVWEVKADGCSPVTEYNDLICFIDRNEEGRLIAINRHTGRRAWQVPGLGSCNAFVGMGRRGYLKTEDSIVRAFAFGS